MARGINPFRRAIVKQSILNGNPGYKALMDAGYKETTAKHHLKTTPVYNSVMQEILTEFKLNELTVETVLCNLEVIKQFAIEKQDYSTAKDCEIWKGKYLSMFTDKQQIDMKASITDEERDILSKYIGGNRIKLAIDNQADNISVPLNNNTDINNTIDNRPGNNIPDNTIPNP